MSFTYVPIPLFNEEHFQHCIVVQYPEGGKIVDKLVVEKTAYLMVEARTNAKIISAHFHIVPAFSELFADSHEYIGTFQIENFRGVELALVTVIKIPEGDFGIFSAEFLAIHGEAERDKIIAQATGEMPPQLENDSELRKLWDFTQFRGGEDKTDDNETPETDSESE